LLRIWRIWGIRIGLFWLPSLLRRLWLRLRWWLRWRLWSRLRRRLGRNVHGWRQGLLRSGNVLVVACQEVLKCRDPGNCGWHAAPMRKNLPARGRDPWQDTTGQDYHQNILPSAGVITEHLSTCKPFNPAAGEGLVGPPAYSKVVVYLARRLLQRPTLNDSPCPYIMND
jgi:hypothetical protein